MIVPPLRAKVPSSAQISGATRVSSRCGIEIDAVHGLSTSMPSSRRQTHGLRLPVGSSAGLSFTAHGKDNSRPKVRHSRTVLTYSDLAQELQQGALGNGDEWPVTTAFKGHDVQQNLRPLVEQALATMALGRKCVQEPFRQAAIQP